MHIEKVKDSLLSMLHPAGFKMFNEVSMIKGFHVGNKLIDSSIEGVVDVISNLTASITPYATTNSELTVTLNNIFAIPGPDIAAICQNNLTLYVELIGETAGHVFL